MEEEQRPRGEHRGRKETASGALQQREGKREKRKEKSEPKADGKKIRLESAASITPGQQVEMKQSADASRAHAAVEGEKDSSSCRTKIYSKSQSDKDRGKAERKKSSAVKEDGATTLANMEPADGQKSTTTSTNHQKQKRSAADNTDHQEKKDRKSSTVDEKHANADDEVSRKTKKKTPTVAHEPERKIVDKVDPPQRRRSLRGRSQESKAIVPATGAENQQSTLPIHLEEKRLYKAQQQEGAKVRSKTAASEPLKTQPPSERTSSRQESKTDKHRSSDQMRKAAPAEEREKVEKYADSIPRISGGKRGEDRQESSSRERKGGNVSEPGKSIASKLKSSQGDTRAKREKSAESEVQNLTEKRTSKKRKPVPETTDSRQPESSQPKSSTASKWKSSEGPPRVQRQTNSEVETRTESRSSKKQNAAPETTESTQPRSSQPKPTAKKRRTSVAKESVVKAVHEEQTEAKRKKPSTSKRGDTGEKVEMKKDIGTKKYQADHGVDILGDSGHGVEAKKIDVHRESGTHRKSAISQQVNGADEGKMKTYQKKQPSGSTVATEEVVAEAYQTRSAPDDGASKKRRRKRRKDNSAGDSAQEAHSQITMVDVQRASSKPSSIPTSQPSSLEDCVASPVVPHNGAAGPTAFPPAVLEGKLSEAQAHFLTEINRIMQIRAAADSTTAVPDEMDSEAVYWKARFDELSQLRLTEPESQLETFRVHVRERENAQNALIDYLRKACATIGDAGSMLPVSSSEASEQLAQLEEKIETQRTLLLMYQQLTSLAISLDGGGESQVTCTAINHLQKRVVQFKLNMPDEAEADDETNDPDVKYTPLANINLLPRYMRQNLTFSRDQSPLFLIQLLQGLYSK